MGLLCTKLAVITGLIDSGWEAARYHHPPCRDSWQRGGGQDTEEIELAVASYVRIAKSTTEYRVRWLL